MSSNENVAYTRAHGWRHAAQRVADLGSWDTLEGMRGGYANGNYHHISGDEYKVTVERVGPESEEEEVPIRWWCGWTPNGFNAEPAYASTAGGYFEWDRNGNTTLAQAAITSTTMPTEETFWSHVTAQTGVARPVVEEAQWWWWYDGSREWGKYPDHVDEGDIVVTRWGSLGLYGTVSDRDQKRDALLAAAQAAGKPEDEA